MSLGKTHWWQPIKEEVNEKSTIRNKGGDSLLILSVILPFLLLFLLLLLFITLDILRCFFLFPFFYFISFVLVSSTFHVFLLYLLNNIYIFIYIYTHIYT